MTLDAIVAAEVAASPLARLTHFTPSRNLPHILRDLQLRSVAEMSADVRACYTATDLLRLDGYPDKVCCSLQFPNGYYLAEAMVKPEATNFPDWVCLLIDKTVAATKGTLFCPRNAAAVSSCRSGVPGLRSCYADAVLGQGGRIRHRGPNHDPGSPTDVQAEVLVTAPIPLDAVFAIVVPTEDAAIQELSRLRRMGCTPPKHLRWLVSGGMFDKNRISSAVRGSHYFEEVPWTPTSVKAR